MTDNIYHYDVIVIGAGHAGTEAAAAAARLGAKTALLTNNLDTVGQMSCNPAIGGVAKGQIVREVDALGGLMGQAIDATGIQFRLLNRRKGPAMHSPRAQADKKAYQNYVKYQIESQDHLDLRQETVEDLMVIETELSAGSEGCVSGVVQSIVPTMLSSLRGHFFKQLCIPEKLKLREEEQGRELQQESAERCRGWG